MTGPYIGGRWIEPQERDRRQIHSPATGTLVTTVTDATIHDVHAAVTAARRAFDTGAWRSTPTTDRSSLLVRIADRLAAQRDTVARLESGDTGKRLVESKMDVDDVIAVFRHFAHIAHYDAGRVVDTGIPTIASRVVTEPVGVCALITPWNYPLLQLSWKVAPALAAGNTIVMKPSELTPSTAIWLTEAFADEGVPDGVVNLVLGPGDPVGSTLVAAPEVDLVSFTGGLTTGKAIMAAASAGVKRVALELGGKNPNIVFADADLDAALDHALTAVFLDSGQVCSAGARLIVEASIHDDLVDELVARARKIRLGPPDDQTAETGPLISGAHRDKVHAYVTAAIHEGAVLRCGGGPPDDAGLAAGHYYLPTILDGCDTTMDCVQNESFGPVLTIETFRGDNRHDAEQAAIALGNDTIYGLAGAVWTQDAGRAERVAGALRHGTIWINDYHPYVPQAEWGGFKQSGIGRELGLAGLDEYREQKHIWHNTRPAPQHWFGGDSDA